MYFLRLTCSCLEADLLSAELWDLGTAGIQEIEYGQDNVVLLAGFTTNEGRGELLRQFASYHPEWQHDDVTDWVAYTKEAWPPRCVGKHIYLAPPWCTNETPPGRLRVVHNPGLACGTGEHPCTQLALVALEQAIQPGNVVADIGAGSSILTIAAVRLGASFAVAVDTDEAALTAARENFELNEVAPLLVAGSADALQPGWADVTVANISGTVLLMLMHDLRRITKPGGTILLTGFSEWELPIFQQMFSRARVSEINEWRCLTATL